MGWFDDVDSSTDITDDLTLHPEWNAPNTAGWNAERGDWDILTPKDKGYDPTYGGYTPPAEGGNYDDPRLAWLRSVHQAQGWDWPNNPDTPGPVVNPTQPPPKSPPGPGQGPGPGPSGGGSRSSGGGGWGGGGTGLPLPSAAYIPWTRPFASSLGALPPDLMQAITERYTPTAMPADLLDPITARYTSTTMPADLLDKWDRTFTAPDPSKLLENPVVQARLALGRDAAEKSAMAQGTLYTGGFAKGLNEFGQQVATEEYDDIYNRARGEFLDAFGTFSGDKSRRQGVWNDQNQQGLSAFNTNTGLTLADRAQRGNVWSEQNRQGLGAFAANTGLTLADRGQRAGIYGDQWGRDWTKHLGDYNIAKENQTIPFGMSTDVYRLGQGDWGLRQGDWGLRQGDVRLGQTDRQIGQQDRALDENFRMGAFNRNRLGYLDQFDLYKYQDSSFWDRLLRGAELGRPS